MALRIDADLELFIDNERATLTGSGQVLRLTLSNLRSLQDLRLVSLPSLGVVGSQAPTFRDLPGLLTRQGLTLEVADRQGPLLILGTGAAGRSFSLPGLGKIEHLMLANKRAAFRLALSARV